jgi:hypothetical protein
MELDPIVALQDRRVLVREAAPLERLAPELRRSASSRGALTATTL